MEPHLWLQYDNAQDAMQFVWNKADTGSWHRLLQDEGTFEMPTPFDRILQWVRVCVALGVRRKRTLQ